MHSYQGMATSSHLLLATSLLFFNARTRTLLLSRATQAEIESLRAKLERYESGEASHSTINSSAMTSPKGETELRQKLEKSQQTTRKLREQFQSARKEVILLKKN